MHKPITHCSGILAGLIAAALLAGCSATGPRFAEQPVPTGRALVYVYRPGNAAFIARTVGLEINGTRVAGLKNSGYVAIDVAPGTHDVKAAWDLWIGDRAIDKPLVGRLELAAGSTVYLRFSTSSTTGPGSVPGTFTQTMRWALQRVTPEAARAEIAQTSRVDVEGKPPDAPVATPAGSPPPIETAK